MLTTPRHHVESDADVARRFAREARFRQARRLAFHVAAGITASLLIAAVEASRALRPRVSFWAAFTVAGATLSAFGGALGFATWLVSLVVPARLRAVVARLVGGARLLPRDLALLGPAMFFLLAAIAIGGMSGQLHIEANRLFRRQDFAAWWIGIAILTTVVGGAVLTARVNETRVMRRVPPAAILAAALAISATLLLGASYLFSPLMRELRVLYRPQLMQAPFLAALGVLVGWWLTLRFFRDRGSLAPQLATLCILIGSLVSVLLLDRAFSRVRLAHNALEATSYFPPLSHKLLLQATDWDRDGHSSWFGGGDCRPFDARVFPGAPDRANDGINSDCAAGDGTPLATHTDTPINAPYGLVKPNIIVVTLDALRFDALMGPRGTTSTPSLRVLAGSGLNYVAAWSPGVRTVRSIPSIWTGDAVTKLSYGAEYRFPTILDSNRYVSEVATDAGYATSAVIGTLYLSYFQGIAQGFQTVAFSASEQPPPRETADAAIAEIDRLSGDPAKPWLLWVHGYWNHFPYLWHHAPHSGIYTRTQYNFAAKTGDTELGRIMSRVQQLRGGRKTVVIVTADHGEAFEEHRNRVHGDTLYEEEIHVPLVIWFQGAPMIEVHTPVSGTDIGETVRSLVGQRREGERDLLSVAVSTARKRPATSVVVASAVPDVQTRGSIYAVRRGQFKLMWWPASSRIELYDLAADPNERTDVVDAHADVIEALMPYVHAERAHALAHHLE